MPIRILAIGKKHESWVAEGIVRYEKRLKRPFTTEWLLLPHSAAQGDIARNEESARILEKIKPDEFVVVLDEKGTLYDSPSLAALLSKPLDHSQQVTLVIGGAYGVNGDLLNRATAIWSLSPLVFPHQLVRLLVAEQLYRAQEILAGHPYHHE